MQVLHLLLLQPINPMQVLVGELSECLCKGKSPVKQPTLMAQVEINPHISELYEARV